MTRGEFLRWGATFLAFPLAGLAARAAAGPVDDVTSALVGGLAAGAVIGTAQAVGAWSRLDRHAMFAAASAVAVAVGLALGSAVVGYGAGIGQLAVQGAVIGAVLGLAQAPFLRPALGDRARAWPVVVALAWLAGWITTTAAGIDVESRWAVFGASGALVATAITGVALLAGQREPVSLEAA